MTSMLTEWVVLVHSVNLLNYRQVVDQLSATESSECSDEDLSEPEVVPVNQTR